MKLFTFEELSNILELNAQDKTTDELSFNTAYSFMEKYIYYNLKNKTYNEIQTVTDNKAYANEINISKMISIIDMTTKQKIKNYIIDSGNKAILFLTCEYNKHVIYITYKAGFTNKTFPDELKQAVIKLFLNEKKNLQNKINYIEETENKVETLPQDIKSILDTYSKKRL